MYLKHDLIRKNFIMKNRIVLKLIFYTINEYYSKTALINLSLDD